MPIVGYWISPRGEVISVSGAREHYGAMCQIFPDKPWEKVPQFMLDWAMPRGWIRITNSIGFPHNDIVAGPGTVKMTTVQGLRKAIYKQWETIYDLAVENNSKKIGVEYYDYGRDSYTEVDIEDAIKPPRPSVIAEENPRYVGYRYGSRRGKMGAGTFFFRFPMMSRRRLNRITLRSIPYPRPRTLYKTDFYREVLKFRNPFFYPESKFRRSRVPPPISLFLEWFPPKTHFSSGDWIIMEREVAKEARRRGYDAIIYGNQEIQDLREI